MSRRLLSPLLRSPEAGIAGFSLSFSAKILVDEGETEGFSDKATFAAMTFSDDCRLSPEAVFSGDFESEIEGRFASIALRTEGFSGDTLVLLLDFSA